MNLVARRKGVEQGWGHPDDPRLGDRATYGTCPRGAAMARHCHVGDLVLLGRGITRRDFRRHWHQALPVGLERCHVRMWAHHDSP